MTELTNQIHYDWPSKQHRYEDQDPGKVGSLELKQSKEVIPDIRVSPAPDVDQHGGESLPKKYHTNCHCRHNLWKQMSHYHWIKAGVKHLGINSINSREAEKWLIKQGHTVMQISAYAQVYYLEHT